MPDMVGIFQLLLSSAFLEMQGLEFSKINFPDSLAIMSLEVHQ